MKSITTVSIDSQLREEARLFITNFSGEFEEFLRLRIAQAKGSSSQANLVLLEKQFQQEEESLQKQSVKVQGMKQQMIILKKELEEKAINRIEKQKKEIDQLKRCVLCGSNIENQKYDKAYLTDNGKQLYVHRNCWFDWATGRKDISSAALQKHCEREIEI